MLTPDALALPKLKPCIEVAHSWLPSFLNVGIAIGLLGALGIVLALYQKLFEGEENKLRRVIAMCSIAVLLFAENCAIVGDQADRSKKEEFAWCEQLHHFNEIAEEIQHSFDVDQQHFKATVGSIDQTLKAATTARNQTQPFASVESTRFQISDLVWSGQHANLRYWFKNQGTAKAKSVRIFGKLYADWYSTVGSVGALQSFRHDWDEARKSGFSPWQLGKSSDSLEIKEERPSLHIESQTFKILADPTRVLYFFFESEYQDKTGTWGSFSCRKLTKQGSPEGEACAPVDDTIMNNQRFQIPKAVTSRTPKK